MGRVLRHILEQLSKGFYLDSMSSWYDMGGNQIFGLRYVNYVQDYLGTQFLSSLDNLIQYQIVSNLRKLCRHYGLLIGGGGITEEKRMKGNKQNKLLHHELEKFDKEVSENFGQLSTMQFKKYTELLKLFSNIQQIFLPIFIQLGKLQLLRKLITKQIAFAAKVESAYYTNCLEALNYSVLHNLDELRENSRRTLVEKEEEKFWNEAGALGEQSLNQTKMLT